MCIATFQNVFQSFLHVGGPRKPAAWYGAYVSFIFRTLLANIYENIYPGPLERILGAPLNAVYTKRRVT